MADGYVTARLEGGAKLQELSTKLAAAGRGDLQRNLRRDIRRATNPVIVDLRRAVMGVQVSSSRGGTARPHRDTHLRQRIAAALATQVSQNRVRVMVNPRRVDPNRKYGERLPKYLDAELTNYLRWRHPVFGHDVWVNQAGQPWFFITWDRHVRDIQDAVIASVEKTTRELLR